MIDFHNHILPGIDDGAKNIDVSIKMVREAHSQGITDIINTVHYQHPKMEGKEVDFKSIEKATLELQSYLDSNNIDVKIHIGAEVFFKPGLLEIKIDRLAVFGHGKYMLIEFFPFHLPPNFDGELYKLKLSGTTPIIAHPERNRMIQLDIDILVKLIHSGCLVQLDAGSLLGHFGPTCQHVAKLLLDRNMVHFIGSDAHNDKKRNFCLLEASEIARKIVGDSVEILINGNPKKVISGENIIPFDINEPHSAGNFITRLLK